MWMEALYYTMRYFPIIDELFASDTIVFMLIGLALAAVIGVKMKNTKKNLTGMIGSIVLYAICEVISNIHTNFMVELVLLFVGTIALGGVVGFLVGLIVSKVRKSGICGR